MPLPRQARMKVEREGVKRQAFDTDVRDVRSEDGVAVASGVAADLSSHIADTGNPHSVTAAQAGADPAGTAAAAIATHEAAVDPHPGYLTPAEGNAAYQPLDTQLTSLAGLSYASNALKVIRVNAGETGFELDAGGGGGGTVTSVAMTAPAFLSVAGSPVTTSGTLAVTLATQTANQVFAGPTSGGAAAPTFRALVTADMPTPSILSTTVAGSAAQQITVTGLDLDTYLEYEGTVVLSNATASNANISFYLNSDTTAANYDKTFNTTTNANTVTRAANAIVAGLQGSETCTIHFRIVKDADGKVTIFTWSRDRHTTNITERVAVVRWNTATPVTQFIIDSSVAASLSVGNYARCKPAYAY